MANSKLGCNGFGWSFTVGVGGVCIENGVSTRRGQVGFDGLEKFVSTRRGRL